MEKLTTNNLQMYREGIAKETQNTIKSMLKIGEYLTLAKEECIHGEFGIFLNEIGYSTTNASRFMKLHREMKSSDVATFEKINGTKIFELLSLEQEDRKQFVEDNDVNEMTVKEIRKAVKDTKTKDSRKIEFKKSEFLKLIDLYIDDKYTISNTPYSNFPLNDEDILRKWESKKIQALRKQVREEYEEHLRKEDLVENITEEEAQKTIIANKFIKILEMEVNTDLEVEVLEDMKTILGI